MLEASIEVVFRLPGLPYSQARDELVEHIDECSVCQDVFRMFRGCIPIMLLCRDGRELGEEMSKAVDEQHDLCTQN